jgi:hypothetical protein
MTLMHDALVGNGLLSHDPHAPLRAHPRHPVHVEASLLMYQARYEVVVTDISRGGAMVVGDAVPARGDEVVLSRADFQIVATVAWSEGRACGLAFHRPIDPETLLIHGKKRPT